MRHSLRIAPDHRAEPGIPYQVVGHIGMAGMHLLLIGFVCSFHQYHDLGTRIQQVLQRKVVDRAFIIERMHERPGKREKIDLIDFQFQRIKIAAQQAVLIPLVESQQDLNFRLDEFAATGVAHAEHQALFVLVRCNQHFFTEHNFGLRTRKTPVQQSEIKAKVSSPKKDSQEAITLANKPLGLTWP